MVSHAPVPTLSKFIHILCSAFTTVQPIHADVKLQFHPFGPFESAADIFGKSASMFFFRCSAELVSSGLRVFQIEKY